MSAKDSSARPGFCLTVDERTPRLLVASGTTPRLQRFERGVQVIYGVEPQDGIDAAAAIAAAVEASGVTQRSRTCRRVTIVVSDPMLPQPVMRDDVRADLLTAVLDRLASAKVDDVHIVIASTSGRIVPQETVQRIVGERVWRSFSVLNALSTHDCESDDVVQIGVVGDVPVAINRRVAESDLVIDLRVVSELPGASDATAGGWIDIVLGTASIQTVHGIRGAQASPETGREIAALAAGHIDMISIAAVTGQPAYGPPLQFLSEREWEWKTGAQLAYRGVRRALGSLPDPAARRLYRQLSADYSIVGVFGGSPDDVARLATDCLVATQGVEPGEVADVVALGSPHPNPAGSGSISNPISGAWSALARGGYAANPALVREGGSLIVFHPLAARFSSRQHNAASDFWTLALQDGATPEAVATYEQRLRDDPWLIELYRRSHGFHPLQPFHLWYACQPALRHAGEVIYVGAQRDNARRVGGRAASTWSDALEIAAGNAGTSPRVTYVRNVTPIIIRDVA